MQSIRLIGLVVLSLLTVACSSRAVFVDYQHPENSSTDWFPIPSDAPSRVEVTEPEVPRLIPEINVYDNSTSSRPLTIVEQKDGVGNLSLKFNRSTSSTWELVESALIELDYDIADKDRGNYRFELTGISSRRGLLKLFFSNKKNRLNVVLIPQSSDTLVVIEGIGDELPDSDKAEAILSDLTNYFQTQG